MVLCYFVEYLEIFQYTLQQQLQGLTGVRNIADDIIVYGQTREEHDIALDNCLKRLYNRGFRLNESKCRFLSTSIDFFGQVFSEAGIRLVYFCKNFTYTIFKYFKFSVRRSIDRANNDILANCCDYFNEE